MAREPVPHIHVPETSSTNADAMARALAGAPLPFWLTADRQTAGKGRSGRPWVSGEGNLTASLALPLTCGPAIAAQLSLVAGVAVIDALSRVAPTHSREFRLKWPNDILHHNAKFGGILVETAASGPAHGLAAAIGVGLNIASAPSIDGRATASLYAAGAQVSLKSMFTALTEAMDTALLLWEEGRGFALIRARWLAASLPTGTRLTVHAGETTAEGAFAGLDGDGALVLEISGGRLARFTFGDVTVAG